jgi:hypothetical protein
MAKKKVYVSLLLDETGSMSSCLDETINGYNEYIKSLAGDKKSNYLFTLTKFDSNHTTTVHNGTPIKDVPNLNRETYVPGAWTPLYDAIGRGINALGKKKNVLFVIITDGMENASREYSRQQIFEMIEDKTKNGWSFVYLGANQDAYAVGAQLGVPKGNTSSYSTKKTGETFDAVSRATVSYAANAGAAGVPTADFFADEDLSELEE